MRNSDNTPTLPAPPMTLCTHAWPSGRTCPLNAAGTGYADPARCEMHQPRRHELRLVRVIYED